MGYIERLTVSDLSSKEIDQFRESLSGGSNVSLGAHVAEYGDDGVINISLRGFNITETLDGSDESISDLLNAPNWKVNSNITSDVEDIFGKNTFKSVNVWSSSDQTPEEYPGIHIPGLAHDYFVVVTCYSDEYGRRGFSLVADSRDDLDKISDKQTIAVIAHSLGVPDDQIIEITGNISSGYVDLESNGVTFFTAATDLTTGKIPGADKNVIQAAHKMLMDQASVFEPGF